MKSIATEVDDSSARMRQAAEAQLQRPGFAMAPYFYRSHVTYQRELQGILYRSWLYAGHVSQLRETGDFLLYELGEDSVIVARSAAGDSGLRAFTNICRHRGARVCEASSGQRKSFVCPYHGWVYNLDGSLRAAREMDQLPDFSPADHGLRKLRLEVIEGLVFINFDPDAAALTAAMAPVARPLGAYQLTDARVAHQHTYRIDANWKLCLENYLECYHCATSHRHYARSHSLKAVPEEVAALNAEMRARADSVTGVAGITDEYRALYSAAQGFGACVSHWRYALYEGYLTGSQDGTPVAPLMGSMQGYDGGAGDFQFGPLSFMLAYPDHCVLYRFTPRTLTATDLEVVWLVNGSAVEGRDYDRDALTWLWHQTTLEDEHIILRNSAGVNSHFFEPGPYHPQFEALCAQFVSWYLKTLLDAPT
jgi:Rieske 2Fe-2S family protein